MDYLLDTNTFIDFDIVKNYINGSFLYTDISLFEMLKNKDAFTKVKASEVIISKVINNKIKPISKKQRRFEKLFTLNPSVHLHRFDEMGINVSLDMFRNFLSFLGAILMSVVAAKNNIEILPDGQMQSRINDSPDFVNLISIAIHNIERDYLLEFSKMVYRDSININNTDVHIKLANLTIQKYNSFVNNENYKLNLINKFNYYDLVENNNIEFTAEQLKQYFDSFIYFKSNSSISKSVYLAYISNLVFYKSNFEFNDLIDMNLISITLSLDSKFITLEGKIKTAILNYERTYQLSNSISSKILLLKKDGDRYIIK